MKFYNNILSYTLIPLILLLVGASYVRFIVIHDYIIGYEGVCDPTTNSCFIGCKDDLCSEKYYYSKVEKYAPRIYEQCGNDITDCEDANICLTQNDEKCSIEYCDSSIVDEDCETFIGEITASVDVTDELSNENFGNETINDN